MTTPPPPHLAVNDGDEPGIPVLVVLTATELRLEEDR